MGFKDLFRDAAVRTGWMAPDPATRMQAPPNVTDRDKQAAMQRVRQTLDAERRQRDAVKSSTKSGGTKHSKSCAASRGADAHGRGGDFRNCRKHPTPGCPRCAELSGGAAAREGWMG